MRDKEDWKEDTLACTEWREGRWGETKVQKKEKEGERQEGKGKEKEGQSKEVMEWL